MIHHRLSLVLLSLVPAAQAFSVLRSNRRAATTSWSSLGSSVAEPTVENKVLWSPTTPFKQETAMARFQKAVNMKEGSSYEELWKWSVENSDEFWVALMEFLELEYEGSTETVKEGTTMPDVTYFPNVKLNFAQNMLKHGKPDSPLKDAEALVSISEARDDQRWTFGELRDDASRVASALRKLGVTSEDACGA